MPSARAWPWKRWTSVWFAGTYRYRETVYHIAVTQTVAAGEGIGMTATAGMPVTAGMAAKSPIAVAMSDDVNRY